MTHHIDDMPRRKSIGQPLNYRDAARSHVHGLDEFEAWIAQAERSLARHAAVTPQQAGNIRYAIETLDALRVRLENMSRSSHQKVGR